MPKVSVIIPAYNASEYLSQTLDSVLGQTYRDFEIILVDDGSTDETDQVIAKYRSHLNVVQQENKGPGAARNAGLNIAIGEYLAFLDADDLLTPRKFAIQAAFLDQNPGIDIVYSDGFLFRNIPSGEEERLLFSKSIYLNKNLSGPERSLKILALKNAFPIHAAMLRAEIAREIGGFDEARELSILADWDFWYRAAKTYQFAYLNEVVALYRVIEGGISRNKNNLMRSTQFLERKIESSDDFFNFPKCTKSQFYFYNGLRALKFGDQDGARSRLKKSVRCNHGNISAWLFLLLSIMNGKMAIEIFRFLSNTPMARYHTKT